MQHNQNLQAAEVMSFGGLNVFLDGANGGAYNAAAAFRGMKPTGAAF